MKEYIPHKWAIIKVHQDDGTFFYKVLGCWYGGYGNGDSWRMNSGITKVTEKGDYWLFEGNSGSIYKCYKEAYGAHLLGRSIVKDLEMLKERKDWRTLV